MKATELSVKSLSEARSAIGKVNASSVSVDIMALKAVHRLVKFDDVDAKTANMVKQEMLSRGGDVAVSEDVAKFERKKTDMIVMGTLAQYVRLIRKLRKQPFGDCLKVADELQALLFKDFDVDAAPVW